MARPHMGANLRSSRIFHMPAVESRGLVVRARSGGRQRAGVGARSDRRQRAGVWELGGGTAHRGWRLGDMSVTGDGVGRSEE